MTMHACASPETWLMAAAFAFVVIFVASLVFNDLLPNKTMDFLADLGLVGMVVCVFAAILMAAWSILS